jgi:hypothetical protein
MNRSQSLVFILLIAFAMPTVGQTSDTGLSFEITPGVTIPVGRDADVFKLGGAIQLASHLGSSKFPYATIDIGGNFGIAPVDVAAGEPVDAARLLLIAPTIGLGIRYSVLQDLWLGLHAMGGYYFGFLNTEAENTSGNNPYLQVGGGVSYRLLPTLSLGAGAAYRNYLGLYNDIMVWIGTAYNFQRSPGAAGGQLPPFKHLLIENVDIEPVFPVFYKYYDDHPIGRLTITNQGKIPMEEVEVYIFIKQYMDNPNLVASYEFIKGGTSEKVDLKALFNDRVLEISEGTKVQLNVIVRSAVAGDSYENSLVETVRLHDRNAITWADDRRAAAFVTTKDPSVLRFSKNVSSMISASSTTIMDPHFSKALALHEALTLYGISYVVDPSTPYAEFSKNEVSIDYLQFPNQTLEYKAGDCDDLSILYSALLESLGIETAFITIPGHIFVAFSLAMPPEEAVQRFLKPEDLIVRNNRAWVPVEITQIGGGFLQAWYQGARQWREYDQKGQAAFHPIHEAWKLYEPVGFASEGSIANMPSATAVLEAYATQQGRFVERELHPQVTKLEELIRNSNGNIKYVNRLGVLYARYGLIDKAEQQFQRILDQGDYTPALFNLANLAYLSGDFQRALAFYKRAERREPENAKVLLGLAKTSHELGDLDAVSSYFKQLQIVDRQLADRFSYLDLEKEQTQRRASSSESMREVMVWDED